MAWHCGQGLGRLGQVDLWASKSDNEPVQEHSAGQRIFKRRICRSIAAFSLGFSNRSRHVGQERVVDSCQYFSMHGRQLKCPHLAENAFCMTSMQMGHLKSLRSISCVSQNQLMGQPLPVGSNGSTCAISCLTGL